MKKRFTQEQVLNFKQNLIKLAEILNNKKVDLSLLDRSALEEIIIDTGKTKVKPLIFFKVNKLSKSHIQTVFDLLDDELEKYQTGFSFKFYLKDIHLGSIDFYFLNHTNADNDEIKVSDYSDCDGISDLLCEIILKSKTNQGYCSLSELNLMIAEFIEFEQKLIY